MAAEQLLNKSNAVLFEWLTMLVRIPGEISQYHDAHPRNPTWLGRMHLGIESRVMDVMLDGGGLRLLPVERHFMQELGHGLGRRRDMHREMVCDFAASRERRSMLALMPSTDPVVRQVFLCELSLKCSLDSHVVGYEVSEQLVTTGVPGAAQILLCQAGCLVPLLGMSDVPKTLVVRATMHVDQYSARLDTLDDEPRLNRAVDDLRLSRAEGSRHVLNEVGRRNRVVLYESLLVSLPNGNLRNVVIGRFFKAAP